MNAKQMKLMLSSSLIALASLSFSGGAYAGDGDNDWQPNRKHNDGCSHYRISVYGGDGALRLMSNPKDLRRTSNGSSAGRFCTNGPIQIELAKRDVGTHIKFDINGQRYNFGQGDHGHKHLKGWYRKYININLPYNTSRNQERYQTPVHANRGHNRGYGHGQKPPRNNRYNDHYAQNQYGYNQNHGYGNNNGSYNNHANQGYNSGHGHYQNQGHNNKPWFLSKSRKHRKAHKRGYDHVHNGRYFAFR